MKKEVLEQEQSHQCEPRLSIPFNPVPQDSMEIYSNTFPDIEHDPDCAYLAPTGGGNQQLPDDQRSSAAESFDTVIRLDGNNEEGSKDNEDIADMSSVADDIEDEEDHSRSDSQHSIKSFIANADDLKDDLKDEDNDAIEGPSEADFSTSEANEADIGNTVANTFVINEAPFEAENEGGNTSEAFFENETIFASSHTAEEAEDEPEEESISHITSQSSGDNFLIEIAGEKIGELSASEPISVSETITLDTTGCDTVQTALEAGDTTFDTTFDESVASGTDQSESSNQKSHQPVHATHSTAEISFEQALEEREKAFLSEMNATDDEKAAENDDVIGDVNVDASPWSTTLDDSATNPWDTAIDTNVDPFGIDSVQTSSDPFGDTIDPSHAVDPFGEASVNNNDPFGFDNKDPFGESTLVQSESVHSVIPNPSAPFQAEPEVQSDVMSEVEPEIEPFNMMENSESDEMPALAQKKRELVIPVFDIPCPGDDDYNENQIPVAVQPPTPMNITPSEERNKFPFPAVTSGTTSGPVNVAMTAAEELEKKVEKQLEEAALMLENIEEAITKSPSPTDFMIESAEATEDTFEGKELEGYIKFESEPESELFNPPPITDAGDVDEDIIGDHGDLDTDDSRPLIPGFKPDHVEPFSVRLEEKLLNDFLTEYKTEIKNNLQSARLATNNLLEHQIEHHHQPVRRVVSDSGAYSKDRSDSYQESTETKLESLLRSSSTEQKPDLFADIPMPVVPGNDAWAAPPPISKIIVPENPLFSMPQMSLEEVMNEAEDEPEIPITMTRSISTLIDPSNIAKEISPSLSLPDLQREYELSSLIQNMSKTPEPTPMSQNEPEQEENIGQSQFETVSIEDRIGDQMDFDSTFIGKNLGHGPWIRCSLILRISLRKIILSSKSQCRIIF